MPNVIDTQTPLGDRLVALRETREIGRTEAARQITEFAAELKLTLDKPVSRTRLQNWELNRARPPNGVLLVIARFYGADYNEMSLAGLPGASAA